MLSVQPRSTTFTIQIGVGATPTWTTLTTYGDNATFSTSPFTFTGTQLSALSGQANAWIRIVALTASSGSGNRDTIGLDDVSLSYAPGATSPIYSWIGNDTTLGGDGTWDQNTTASWSASDTTIAAVTWDTTKTANFEGTSGTVTIDGAGVTASNGIQFSSSGYLLTGGAITLVTNPAITVTNASDTATISSKISGTAGVTKGGNGTLILSGANDYTGGTTIGGGVLSISSDGNLGATSGGITLGGGTLQSTANISLDAGRAITGSGTLAPNAGTNLTINGSISTTALIISTTGTVTVAGTGATNAVGALTFSDAGTLANTGTNPLAVSSITTSSTSLGTATVSGPISLATGTHAFVVNDSPFAPIDLAITGNITGTGGITKTTGTGTLSLTGTNSQSGKTLFGGTTATGGTISIGNGSVLGTAEFDFNTGTLSNDSGATITLGMSNISFGGFATSTGSVFAGSDIVFNGAVGLFNAGPHKIVANNTTTFNGILTSGTSTGLTVGGTGKLVLTNDSSATYTVTTTVADSLNLQVTGKIAGVVVGGTGTLSGSGTVGALTVQSGATVSPGVGLGKLTAGPTSLLAGGAYKLELQTDGSTGTAGVNWDQLAVNGTLDLSALTSTPFTIQLQTLTGGGSNGLLASWDGSSDHTWFGIATTTNVTNFASSDFNIDTTGFANVFPGQFSVVLDADGTSLDLAYSHVPEPSAFLSLGLGMVGLLSLRRFRRLA